MKAVIAAVVFIASVATSSRLDLNQGIIVHMFEWRWADIALECEEFLAPYGFKGIQISPPNENLIQTGSDRPWWERYQPISYNLTTRSGTEDELKDMMKRCNAAGVRVFPDVVFNHMTGGFTPCVGTAGNTCDPDALSFPGVGYTQENFHYPECDIDNYQDATNVRNCKLSGLHDLNQTLESTRGKIVGYLNSLIDIGAAGFRVDAAKHMWPSDLEVIFGRLHNLNTDFGFDNDTQALIYQEVIDMDGSEAVHYQEYTSWGLATDFRFGNDLGQCFQGNNPLKKLYNFGTEWNLLPENESIVFIENHDTERGDNTNILNYKIHQAYKMAIAYELAWGYSLPKILSSFAFDTHDQGPPHDNNYNILSPRPIINNICSNGWNCQHRWRQIYNMARFHNVVQGASVTNWWDDGLNQIAFCKGNKGFIAFNLDSSKALSENLQTCLPEGTYCDVISGNLENGVCTGKSVSVGSDGYAQIDIVPFTTSNTEPDGVLALHVEARIYCPLETQSCSSTFM